MSEKKTLLVGMAPGPRTDPRAPLLPYPKNSAGYKLAKLTGLSHYRYLQNYERINCLTMFPGAHMHQKGDRFPMREARGAAGVHVQHFPGRRVIFVGRKTAEAFGWPRGKLDFFDWARCPEWCYDAAVVPHASGCNLFWNEPGNKERALVFFQRELESR